MNHLFRTLFLLFVSSVVSAKDVDSKITSVTVYPSGATVERSATASLAKGTNTLRFVGVSNTLNQKSIQLEAAGDYIVQSISYRYDFLKPVVPNPKIKILQDSVLWLNDELGKFRAMRESHNAEIQFLTSNSSLHVKPEGSQSVELEKIADILRVRLPEIKLKLHKLGIDERNMNQRIQRINRQINELRGFSPERTGIIELKLIAEKPIKGAFKLTYFVSHAGWRPSYDLKFTEVDQPIEMKFNAWVQQNTGIDWKDAKLTLSTSTPKLSNAFPKLHPWSLYFKEPQNYSLKNTRIMESYSYSERSANINVSGNWSEDAEESAPAFTGSDFTAMMQTMISTDFEIDLPYTIESDGKENLINLRKEEIPAEFNYYAAPKVEQEAFLVAGITDWYKLDLLPGPTNMFIGNTYMGQGYINPGISSDTLELAFGRDKMVKVERKLLSRSCDKGFMVGKQKHKLEYVIAIRNMHKDVINIKLEDQVPISTIEEIEVEVLSKSGAKHDKDTGLLTWELNLEPGKAEKKKFSFSVKHPRNKVVYPLNNVN